jgi:phosphoribosyl 1,2-cyclic phosphate phosphodiesterase
MTIPYTVTVLGSGTSAGVPVIGCQCPVCQSPKSKNKRLRSSIVLTGREQTILVDCGSDFRQQALHYRINSLDAILLTHAHSDHVSGLDEVRLYNWLSGRRMPVYGSTITLEGVRRRFDYLFNPMQLGGGVADVELITVGDQPLPFDLFGAPVVPLPVMHGKLPINGYRFGDFAYITDASFIPPETLEAVRGVRYLILNALRPRPHPTHLCIPEATAIALEIGAEQTWFTHLTHDVDHDDANAELPPGIQLAYDGLQFTINA